MEMALLPARLKAGDELLVLQPVVPEAERAVVKVWSKDWVCPVLLTVVLVLAMVLVL